MASLYASFCDQSLSFLVVRRGELETPCLFAKACCNKVITYAHLALLIGPLESANFVVVWAILGVCQQFWCLKLAFTFCDPALRIARFVIALSRLNMLRRNFCTYQKLGIPECRKVTRGLHRVPISHSDNLAQHWDKSHGSKQWN